MKLQLYLEEQKLAQIDMADETTYIDFLKRTAQPEFKAQIQNAVEILRDRELVLFAGWVRRV